MVKLKSLLRTFYARNHDLVKHSSISVSTITTHKLRFPQSHFRPHFFLREITGFITRIIRRKPLVEEEGHTRQEHQSPPVVSMVCVAQYFGLCVFLSFCFWSLYYLSVELRLLISPFFISALFT